VHLAYFRKQGKWFLKEGGDGGRKRGTKSNLYAADELGSIRISLFFSVSGFKLERWHISLPPPRSHSGSLFKPDCHLPPSLETNLKLLQFSFYLRCTNLNILFIFFYSFIGGFLKSLEHCFFFILGSPYFFLNTLSLKRSFSFPWFPGHCLNYDFENMYY
jgi:hypothetical protein